MKVNLFGIGSAKCGTTSLFDILNRHPDVCGSRVKEADFFANERNYNYGENWYHEINYPHYSGQLHVLDFTPNYSGVSFSTAAKRISLYNPNAKLIYILRDPFDKLKSGWQMCLRNYEMKICTDNPAVSWARYGFSEWVGQQWASGHIKSLYYGKIINEYLKFFPRSSLYITTLESLSQSYRDEILRLLNFLGLSESAFDFSSPVQSNSRKGQVGRFSFLARIIEGSLLSRMPKAQRVCYGLRTQWLLKDLPNCEANLEPHIASELAMLLRQDYLDCQVDLNPHISRFRALNSFFAEL